MSLSHDAHSCPFWLMKCDNLHQQEINRPVSLRLLSILSVAGATTLRTRHPPDLPLPFSAQLWSPVSLLSDIQTQERVTFALFVREKNSWSISFYMDTGKKKGWHSEYSWATFPLSRGTGGWRADCGAFGFDESTCKCCEQTRLLCTTCTHPF